MVKVGIASRKTLVIEDHRCRMGSSWTLYGWPFEVSRGSETVKILCEWQVVFVSSIVFGNEEDGVLV